MTKINPLNPEKEKLKEAASILKKGGVLIFPTDTVYGIGTSYKNEAGLKKIFALKQRPEIKPLAILVESKKMALGIVESNKKIEKEVEKVWPGAVTLLLKAKIPLSPFLRDSSSKVGLRVPDYPLLLKLLKISGPLAATSANISGQPADCQIETIEKKILKGADLIIDGGKTSGKESSVWDFTGEPAKLIRGEILFVCTGNSCRSPMAAGLMKKMLEEKGNKNIRVDSAGFLFSARGATKEAIEVMKGEGIDLLNHRSKLATPFLVKNFDLILVMGEIHKERILKMFHQAAERVFVLDIPDPIGKPLTFYEQTLKTIKEKIKEIVLPKIV